MFLRHIRHDCNIHHGEVTRLWLHLGLKIATFMNKYHASYEYTSLKESLFSQCRRSLKWLFSPRGQYLRVRLNKTKNDLPNWLSTETSVMFLGTLDSFVLAGRIGIPSDDTRWPTKSNGRANKTHFFGLNQPFKSIRDFGKIVNHFLKCPTQLYRWDKSDMFQLQYFECRFH